MLYSACIILVPTLDCTWLKEAYNAVSHAIAGEVKNSVSIQHPPALKSLGDVWEYVKRLV